MRPVLEHESSVWDLHIKEFQDELEKVQNRVAMYMYVSRNDVHVYETGSIYDWHLLRTEIGIPQERMKGRGFNLLYNGLKGKARIPTSTSTSVEALRPGDVSKKWSKSSNTRLSYDVAVIQWITSCHK